MSPLLGETAEIALDLLEKNGVLSPFCNLTDRDSARVLITPEGEGMQDKAEESVRIELARQLEIRDVRAFAVCSDVEAKFADKSAAQRCLKIEFQDGSDDSGVYYFPLTFEDGRGLLGSYLVADLAEKLL